MKSCTWLPLARLEFFPEQFWGGEFSGDHFVSMTVPCQPPACGFPAVLLLDLCELWAGCLSRKGTGWLHSERSLKGVQWRRTDRGGKRTSECGPGSGYWAGGGVGGVEQGSVQVSRTEMPTNSCEGVVELLTLGTTWLALASGLKDE